MLQISSINEKTGTDTKQYSY